MFKKDIENKLSELRLRYKNQPEKRKTILMQARLLQIALDILKKRQPPQASLI